MSKIFFQNKLIVKKSKTHGFGVFAGKRMRKGERLEECYAIFTRGGDKVLDDYYFDINNRRYAFLTGYGSIYNHSDEPNADYRINKRTKIATIVADCVIEKGEEIFVSYGTEYFTTRGMVPKQSKVKSNKRNKGKTGKKNKKRKKSR